MAKLPGDIKFTGTVESLSFYAMYGNYYVRTKSSLTGKRFWKDRAFEGSRRSCSQLAKASALASGFYKTYPKEKKKRGLFNEMTGKVKLWLKEGRSEEEALLLLQLHYPVIQEWPKAKKKIKRTIVVRKRESVFTVLEFKNIVVDERRVRRKKRCCLRE